MTTASQTRSLALGSKPCTAHEVTARAKRAVPAARAHANGHRRAATTPTTSASGKKNTRRV